MRGLIVVIILVLISIGVGYYLLPRFKQEEISSAEPTPLNFPSTSTPQPRPQPARLFEVSHTELTHVKTYDRLRLTAALIHFTRARYTPVTDRVDEYNLSFVWRISDNSLATGSAKVFVPQVQGVSPLHVFASGTTGLASRCAPSLEKVEVSNIGNYQNHMLAQASQGQIMIFPDYDGFHEPESTHNYFVAEQEARILLASVKALSLVKSELINLPVISFNNIVFSGYSQGGHAALAAASRMASLTPEFDTAGVIGFASAQDILALLKDQPSLAPYLTYAYEKYYTDLDYDFTSILQTKWQETLEADVLEHCIDTLYTYYPDDPVKIYNPEFFLSLETSSFNDSHVVLNDYLALNTPTPQLLVPIILIQGGSDFIVSAETQKNNLAQLCARDNQVYYDEIKGVDHFTIRQQSFAKTQHYLTQLYARNFTLDSCQL